MKSYLELIPITARVRRRQNRLTILCIVTAVFLVTAIFSVADMMLQTQMDRAARKDGSWHLEVTGIPAEQAAELARQPDVLFTGLILLVGCAAALAVHGPVRRLTGMPVTAAVQAL